MNLEQLEKGKELAKKIEILEKDKNSWKDSNGFYSDGIFSASTPKNYNTCIYLDLDVIGFDKIKELALEKINAELSDLKNEFEKL